MKETISGLFGVAFVFSLGFATNYLYNLHNYNWHRYEPCWASLLDVQIQYEFYGTDIAKSWCVEANPEGEAHMKPEFREMRKMTREELFESDQLK